MGTSSSGALRRPSLRERRKREEGLSRWIPAAARPSAGCACDLARRALWSGARARCWRWRLFSVGIRKRRSAAGRRRVPTAPRMSICVLVFVARAPSREPVRRRERERWG